MMPQMLTSELIKSVATKACRVQYTASLYVDTFAKASANHFVKPVAPILVLNGGIGRPESNQTKDFISHCSHNWDKVLYVPGSHELKQHRRIDLAQLRQLCLPYSNVRVLSQETYVSMPYNTVFMAAPLQPVSEGEDMSWLLAEYNKWKDTRYKLVILTAGRPRTATSGFEADLYPDVNAWISGHTHGAAYIEHENGVILAYNARGSLEGPHDMHGLNGWSRTTAMVIPENREINDVGFRFS
jgi:hypothetical protein